MISPMQHTIYEIWQRQSVKELVKIMPYERFNDLVRNKTPIEAVKSLGVTVTGDKPLTTEAAAIMLVKLKQEYIIQRKKELDDEDKMRDLWV